MVKDDLFNAAPSAEEGEDLGNSVQEKRRMKVVNVKDSVHNDRGEAMIHHLRVP